MSKLTQARLKELLSYDPETGVWTNLVARRGIGVGSRAGYVNSPTGYRMICIEMGKYSEHRLAFLYMLGRWPGSIVDHVNGEPGDNRWVNLREATYSQNGFNKKIDKRNLCGVKGVTKTRSGKWAADIRVGSYATVEEAIEAIERARELIHGTFANHG